MLVGAAGGGVSTSAVTHRLNRFASGFRPMASVMPTPSFSSSSRRAGASWAHLCGWAVHALSLPYRRSMIDLSQGSRRAWAATI